MGGFGSGGWNAKGGSTTSNAKPLDVNRLNTSGQLKPGVTSQQYWTCGGEPSGDIGVEATGSGIALIYRTRSHGGDWHDVREPVTVIWQPCHFGGQRPYFLCPRCRAKIEKLYGLARFLCRSCNNLTYMCQRESASDRTLRKDWKLRAKLGGEPGMNNPIPDKPKGMHWSTYECVVAEISKAEALAFDFALRLIDRLDRQLGKKGFWT